MPIEEIAPAKLNLTLHVTGRRADLYHLLDSLVAFAALGDLVTVADAPELSLSVTGPEAGLVPAGPENLALAAARLAGETRAALRLDKRLPVASGLGGGSSDAAAVLRALARLRGAPLAGAARALLLGADLPVCLDPRPRRMSGTGEVLSSPLTLPPAWLVLVNPRIALATPAVFAALDGAFGPPMPKALPGFADAATLAAFLRTGRNDLQAPAIRLAPAIAEVLAALGAQPGCLLARMSGSGATCFGLFPGLAGAGDAAAAILRARPGWWVEATGWHRPGAAAA